MAHEYGQLIGHGITPSGVRMCLIDMGGFYRRRYGMLSDQKEFFWMVNVVYEPRDHVVGLMQMQLAHEKKT